MTSVFYAYRDSPQRRLALEAHPEAAERYLLYGLDQLRSRGFAIRHNLERAAPPAWARGTGGAAKWALERAGGYGGDFATMLASLRSARQADVVFSTVDTVGIPLMLLERAGVLRTPFVYAAIGLPERLARLRSRRMHRLYARSLAGAASVLAYSEHEAEELRRYLAEHGHGTRVEFVPFAVDAERFPPSNASPQVDVVSIGADPHRDYGLLLRVAERLPDLRFRIVASADHARELGRPPENVEIELDLPFPEMRRRLEEARVVALPVLDNSYSGATTVLLQAMALAKPVVVTRTRAIATGYGLVDGENCRLVPPGDEHAFERALADVLADEWRRRALGASARATVERELTWPQYVDRIESALRNAAAA